MRPEELPSLIRNGEDSRLEFKRDRVQGHDLARELAAFLNLEGGTVLLGIEDDGTVAGTNRERLEASREELERMFQASGRLHYGLKPVPGAGLDALDHERFTIRLLKEPRETA